MMIKIQQKHSSPQQQQGAALIVVMILLLAVTIIGTMAVRQGLVSLGVATNSQGQQLLMQNSDAAFFNVKKESNLIQSLSASGMFGYIDGAANKDKELIFCFRGDQTNFFDITKASLMEWVAPATAPANNSLGTAGYCNATPGTTNFFTSGRKAVMTQVAVKFSTQVNNDPFYGSIRGTDDENIKLQRSKPVKVFAVSVMPTLSSNATAAQINTCFNSRMNEVSKPDSVTSPAAGATQSVTQCLSNLNVPFVSHVTEYVIAQDFV